MISFGFNEPPTVSDIKKLDTHSPISGRLTQPKNDKNPIKNASSIKKENSIEKIANSDKNTNISKSLSGKRHESEKSEKLETVEKLSQNMPKPEVKNNKNEADDSKNQIIRESMNTLIIKFSKVQLVPRVIPIQLSVYSKYDILPRIRLVLDLDLTLVQSFVILSDEIRRNLKTDPRVLYFPYEAMQMAIILRPFVKQFLHVIHEFCDIYVYTHGEKAYAELILDKFLDPEKKLVKRDKLCAGDRNEKIKKKKAIENILPDNAEQEKSLIFDDQTNVWENKDYFRTLASMKFAPIPQHDPSVREPQRYYFSCFADENMQKFCDENLPHVENFTSARSQLKYIAAFMRSCYIEFVLSGEKIFANVVQRKLRQTLAEIVISADHFFVFFINS